MTTLHLPDLMMPTVAPRPAPRPGTRRRPWLLRLPAAPYLLVGDLLAVEVARGLTNSFRSVPLVIALVMVAVFKGLGLYSPRLSLSMLNDLPYISTGVVAALGTSVVLHGSSAKPLVTVSAITHLLVLLGVVLLTRSSAYTVIRSARKRGLVRHTALILGAGHVGIRLATDLIQHREYGLDPVGFLGMRPRLEPGQELPAPLLGSYDRLAEMIKSNNARVVIVAFGTLAESQLIEMLRTCDRLRCEILFVPRLFEMHAVTRDMDEIWGVPLVRVRRAPFRRRSWALKRLIDVVIGTLAIVLLSPLMLGCAAAVALSGGRPIIFKQVRVGLDGRPFTVMKFRSFKPTTASESATRWNIANAAELGRVGKLLRKTSLDELPQLFNVVLGHMSLVGPRPERPHFVEEFNQRIPRYMSRHRVPAGMTGHAQVHGLRGDTSIEDRASFDNYYIENWSVWGDIKIILRTFRQVLQRQGG